MRINSVAVRQYRVHRDLKVQFNEEPTLIGGPNECGKSTLAEAMHRAFFLKAKGNTEFHRAMVSNRHAGHPEVEVHFEAGGTPYHLKKRFGSSGTTTLSSPNVAALSGDAAESELARLLGVEAGLGGKAVITQWSHLWVWQGSNGEDPLKHTSGQHSNLLRRLQDSGGAAAMQSDLDAAVSQHFATTTDGLFLQSGKAKTGSVLHRAETAFQQAEAERIEASARLEKAQQLVRDFEEASQTLTRGAAEIVKLVEHKQTVDARLARAEELRTREMAEAGSVREVSERHETLQRGHRKIVELRAKAEAEVEDLAPKNRETLRLEERREAARRHADLVVEAYESAGESTRSARQRRDLAVACQVRLERAARLEELTGKMQQSTTLQQETAQLRQEVARLPELSAKQFQALQRLEAEQIAADSRWQAMAAGIEVLASAEPVMVGGVPLAAGERRILTTDAEVAVGESLRLLIRPGGGTTLTEARQNAQDAGLAFRKALDAHGLESVAAAAHVLAQRHDLTGRIGLAEAALRGLDSARLPAALAEAQTACAAAEAEVARRAESWKGQVAPTTEAEAAQSVTAAERALRDAEAGEARAKDVREVASSALKSAEEALNAHRQALVQQSTRIDEVRAQIRLLVEAHGEDDPRTAALADATVKLQLANEALAATRRSLQDLQPDLLKSDARRLHDALERAVRGRQEAEVKQAVAQAGLHSDGTHDPDAALAVAAARARSAQEHLAGVRRKAEATKLLNELFTQEQRALADQFTRPLAEKISGYLECLFGAGARANVVLAENAFSGLQLVRPNRPGGAVAFDSLSGGAREQVSAAVRLAMAEVLCNDHHGCLPIVFDDAFAYSDPDRVQTLQRMLYLAASRGLQVIILTCSPSDYAALGATHVPLCEEKDLPSGLAPQGWETAAEKRTDGDTEPATERPPVTAEQREELLASLREQGGKAVNQALRMKLGWDDTTYDSVKENLIENGLLAAGRGRGGSVSLA